MDILNRSLLDRLLEALVVFAVLFAFDTYRGSYDWSILVGAPVIFALARLAIDGVRTDFID